ncbi:MAG TPA: MotA/TolQ/ExbB proton channel family protein [Pseudomonadales bacterium]|jgi:biopolymer transport protein ExbB|nr:MotA/TolQ/ExbB proton channel family protein [Pseudomonadales bacterium]
MSKVLVSFLLSVFLVSGVSAQTTGQQITDLDQLLAKVRAEHEKERALNRQREAEFLQERNAQQALLEKARTAYYLAQAKNNPAKMQIDANDAEIAKLRKELQQSVTDMGDVFSVYRQFAGDFAATLNDSQVSAQFPERAAELKKLNNMDALPTIDDMERLWYLVQQEMTESGKVVAYKGKIVAASGEARDADIVRAGTFAAFSGSDFLRFVPETSEFVEPDKQPEKRFLRMAEKFSASGGELAAVPVDPTRGSLLGMLERTPNLRERVVQGGVVGYLTIVVGIIGLLVTLYRTLYLLLVRRRVLRQIADSEHPSPENPLGRIMLSVKNTNADDEETIQYKLDEAILKEVPPMEYGHNIIKLFAAIAPMLGLLGTVTGMIKTFEAISLFGGGDPKLMAAGISEALVCTVLGLLVAVPLLFGHNIVTVLAKSLIQRLDEQSAGILARNMEKSSFARHK